MTKLPVAALLILATPAISQTPPPTAGVTFDQFATKARDHMMALDTDHDGKISKAEFAARAGMMGMRHGGGAGGDAQAGTAAPHRDPSRMFTRFDTNNDGYLDGAEMDAMLARRFARMDANHDRMLTPDERHAMHGANAPEQ